MSRVRHRMSAPRQRQGGAIIAFAAIGLSVLVIMLSITDIGFLYYYKREYQKAADLAAMAGARMLAAPGTGVRSCDDNARPAAADNAARNLGSKVYALQVECGKWTPTAATRAGRLDTSVDDEQLNAVRVTISGVPPRFLPFNATPTISASAVALSSQALAQLTIRSTLVNVDTSQSAALNALFGGLLGGNVSLSAVGWNGLVATDIHLLGYLDQLAIDLGLEVGQYDQLLQTDVEVGDLIGVAIDLLERGEATGDISAAIGGLEALQLSIPPATPLVALGDIVSVGTGTQSAGLDAGIQLFQLVQAIVQAANSKNALAATLDLGIASVQVKVIEPPQISAVGDPELASADPDGPGRIYVNTAQLRTLISVNLPALAGVTDLLNSVLGLAAPVTSLLNNVLSLNLVAAIGDLVGALLGIPQDVTDIQLVPGNPRIDVSLDLAGGEAKVTDYNCEDGQKALDTNIETSIANLRIGQMQTDPNQPGYVFGSDAPPTVGPVPLVDVGVKTCTSFLLIPVSCEARRPFEGGGLGIMAQTTVAGTPYTHTYVDPPDLGQPPLYASFDTQNIVASLANTLAGIELTMYGPAAGGGLGGVLNLVSALYDTVRAILEPVITGLLSPLLDPLLNTLLDTLGIDLNKVEVGGNLSCDGGGATLVD